MYKNIAILSILSLSTACAQDTFLTPNDGAANGIAKILADSLTDAFQHGDLTHKKRIFNDDFHGGTARFEYQDDAWVGRVWGDTIYSMVEVDGTYVPDWVFDVTLDDFGSRSEHFNGALVDITKFRKSGADGYDGFAWAFDGTLDSSVSGVVDLDLEVVLEVGPGYRGVEWSGTVDDEVVAGHVEEKEDIDEGQGGGCKAPIGVDCE